MQTQTQRMKQRYDARVREGSFAEGDFVWYYVPRRKQGRNQKWRKLCDVYRVCRRFNDVLYQIRFSPRAKPIIAHIDKLRRCESDLPVRWAACRDFPSSPATLECRNDVTEKTSPTMDPTMSPTASPIREEPTVVTQRSQATRDQQGSGRRKHGPTLCGKPDRPIRNRRPPVRFRALGAQPTCEQISCKSSFDCRGANIRHQLTNCCNKLDMDTSTSANSGQPPRNGNGDKGDIRRYKYYPRNQEQKAKRRARECGPWFCERCDHPPFSSVTGLQSHAIRAHRLHCDYRGHLSEFTDPSRCGRLLRRLLQREPVEKTTATNAPVTMVDSRAATAAASATPAASSTAAGTTSNGEPRPELTGLATAGSMGINHNHGIQGTAADVAVEPGPTLDCRRFRFESPPKTSYVSVQKTIPPETTVFLSSPTVSTVDVMPLSVATASSSDFPLSLDEIDLDWFDTELMMPIPSPTDVLPSSCAIGTAPTAAASMPTTLSGGIKNIATQILMCTATQTETPALIEVGMQTTAVRRSTQGCQTPCLGELILPPDLQIPVAGRMLLNQPEICSRELSIKASIAAGGLPDARISALGHTLEAIAYGHCQILQLIWKHRVAISKMDSTEADFANKAFLRQMQALLNRPVGCVGGSFVPPLDLQALPATDAYTSADGNAGPRFTALYGREPVFPPVVISQHRCCIAS